MKRHLTKLSDLQASLLLSGIVTVIAIAISSIGFVYNQPGWMIGIAIGGIVSLLNIFLTNISSSATLKESKAGIYLLSYFARMILFIAPFTMLVVFQHTCHFEVFTNSYWGMLIGFVPTTFITIAVQLKN